MRCRNSQSKVRYTFSDLNDADVFVDETIKLAIPEIVSLLRNGDQNVRIAGADALSKLLEKGKVSNF